MQNVSGPFRYGSYDVGNDGNHNKYTLENQWKEKGEGQGVTRVIGIAVTVSIAFLLVSILSYVK